jgi:hypothetical protein
MDTVSTPQKNQDEVFSWGRDVDVDYKDVLWVTFRDQVRLLYQVTMYTPVLPPYSIP